MVCLTEALANLKVTTVFINSNTPAIVFYLLKKAEKV